MTKDTFNEDFHMAVTQLILHHENITPWNTHDLMPEEGGLDTSSIKFYECGKGKPLVHHTAPRRGGLWMRSIDMHEDAYVGEGMNPLADDPARAAMAPASHILKLPAMQDGRLMSYDGRDLWRVVEIIKELAG
ncbi:hypothetical protein [Cognatishimia sp. MH4019]|uniref:hypothetical protein n=1 Tax=Cognatishimia sp. MH4019 TaxID=2854030 RepID=UPI001CD3CC3A|nr:hypothetical protein [Cognatishimia sp. MH4019]